MKIKFTPEYIREHKGCFSMEQVNQLSFINQKEIDILEILNSEIETQHKVYFLIYNCFNPKNKIEREHCFNLRHEIRQILYDNGWGGVFFYAAIAGLSDIRVESEILELLINTIKQNSND